MTDDVYDNPLDHGVTTQLLAALCVPIGLLAVHWPFIEHQLSAIAEITADAAAAAGVKVKRQRQISDKLDYVRSLFTTVPSLHKHRLRADHIFAGLDRIKPVRDAITHGNITRYDAERKIVTFVKVNPAKKKPYHEYEPALISIANIEAVADSSTVLASDLIKFSALLMDELLPDRDRQTAA